MYGVGEETPHGTNLVAMGAGEPFLNFENLIKAIEMMSDEDGLFIVPGRITVSTAGIVPKIYEFANLERRPNLAISLSAPTDELRDVLMPINKRWKIDELMQAAKTFEKTLKRGERFTFEYVLLGGVNDSVGHARELADLLSKHDLRRVKINLIPHNPAEQLDYHPPDGDRVIAFKNVLESLGVSAYVRTPRTGHLRRLRAACGQSGLACRTRSYGNLDPRPGSRCVDGLRLDQDQTSAAKAFDEEVVETDDFTITKPEGFLIPIEASDLAFAAYTKEFGKGDSGSVRQVSAELRIHGGSTLGAVRDAIVAEASKVVSEQHLAGGAMILETELTENGILLETERRQLKKKPRCSSCRSPLFRKPRNRSSEISTRCSQALR